MFNMTREAKADWTHKLVLRTLCEARHHAGTMKALSKGRVEGSSASIVCSAIDIAIKATKLFISEAKGEEENE